MARSSSRAAVAALIFLCIASCGGGGGSAPATGTIVAAAPRAGIQFGFWSGNPLYLIEQCGNVDLWWARDDDPTHVWHLAIAAQLQAARGCGITNIVLHLRDEDPVELRFQLGKLSDGGWLKGWRSIKVYKWDEPDTPAGGNLSDQEVRDRVTRVRQVLFDTGLSTAKIGVFFQCASGRRPGLASFDVVGCYRYEAGACAKLESDFAAIRTALLAANRFDTRLWVIAAGSWINGKDGHQDPACWASYAFRYLDVDAFIGFMWQGGADPRNTIVGIRDEIDMRQLYCNAGRVFLNPTVEPRC